MVKVCGGYILYGPSSMCVYSTQSGMLYSLTTDQEVFMALPMTLALESSF